MAHYHIVRRFGNHICVTKLKPSDKGACSYKPVADLSVHQPFPCQLHYNISQFRESDFKVPGFPFYNKEPQKRFGYVTFIIIYHMCVCMIERNANMDTNHPI